MINKFSKSCVFYSYVSLSVQIYQTTETPPWPWQGWPRHDFRHDYLVVSIFTSADTYKRWPVTSIGM